MSRQSDLELSVLALLHAVGSNPRHTLELIPRHPQTIPRRPEIIMKRSRDLCETPLHLDDLSPLRRDSISISTTTSTQPKSSSFSAESLPALIIQPSPPRLLTTVSSSSFSSSSSSMPPVSPATPADTPPPLHRRSSSTPQETPPSSPLPRAPPCPNHLAPHHSLFPCQPWRAP